MGQIEKFRKSRNPGNRNRDLKITKNPEWEIPKISKSRGSGSGFENYEKSRKTRNPGDRDQDLKITRKSRVENLEDTKIPEIGIYFYRISCGIRDFLSLGNFFPGIREFFLSRDSGFFKSRDFKTGIFYYPRDRDFFVGWDNPTKSQLWSSLDSSGFNQDDYLCCSFSKKNLERASRLFFVFRFIVNWMSM